MPVADNRYYTLPVWARTDPFVPDSSGQEVLSASDAWSHLRWNTRTRFMLSWAEPHAIDQRFFYHEDDWVQMAFPEVESPWKFPDRIYVSSFRESYINDSPYEGTVVELPYFDPSGGPIAAPKLSSYRIDNTALPEHDVRVGQVPKPNAASLGPFPSGDPFASELYMQAIKHGADKVIPSGTRLLLAPFDWLGTKAPELGEAWESQPPIETVPILGSGTNGGYVYQGFSGQKYGYDLLFPRNPIMPHGDPEPIWNDGLDDRRHAHDYENRRKYAHLRGSSDRMINFWGQYTRPAAGPPNFNASGELVYPTADAGLSLRSLLMSSVDYRVLPDESFAWASPDKFSELNQTLFHRTMTGCSLCFKKDKCRKANGLLNAAVTPDNLMTIEGKVLSLGFVRNNYVDVPLEDVNGKLINEISPLGLVYARSFCGYSTGSVWETGYNAKPSNDAMEQMRFISSTDELLKQLHLYNFVSDTCHVNGMPKRAVEFAGNYRLLYNEVAAPLYALNGEIDRAIKGKKYELGFPVRNYGLLPCKMVPMGRSYRNQFLWQLVPVNASWTPAIDLAQYGMEYGWNQDFTDTGSPVIAWFTTTFDPKTGYHRVRSVYAYIWYISPHKEKSQRRKIKRLIEVKHSNLLFRGNVAEAFADEDFQEGHHQGTYNLTWQRWNGQMTNREEVKRGLYVQVYGQWVWKENEYVLSANVSKYIAADRVKASLAPGASDHVTIGGGQAYGRVKIRALPGEIVPFDFIGYAPPKMISWGKSTSDPNTQQNVGKTRYWFDDRLGRYVRETGDIDDLFYHLSYQPGVGDTPPSGGTDYSPGALVDYRNPLPAGEGFYFGARTAVDPSGRMVTPQGDFVQPPSSFFGSPLRPSVNDRVSIINVANPYLSDTSGLAPYSPSTSGIAGTQYERNIIRGIDDVVTASDFRHARNFTAPIFAFEITTDVPAHHVVQPDYDFQKMDWASRTPEPFDIATQRAYGPVPPMQCYQKNTANRESYVNIFVGYGRSNDLTGREGVGEGVFPIKLIFNPMGRRWWYLKGLLGCMVEKRPGDIFQSVGIAIVNLWRKYIPHHMEVVKAYLFLEPTLEHNLGPFQEVATDRGPRQIPGFVPFEGIGLSYYTEADDIKASLYWANMGTRAHEGNQFLGGRIVGRDVSAQLPVGTLWENVKTHSPKILGAWNFPAEAPLNWTPRIVPSMSDLYRMYEATGADGSTSDKSTSAHNMISDIRLTCNGQQVSSVDAEQGSSIEQRNPAWYDMLGQLYEDGGRNGAISDGADYHRNANVFQALNTVKDHGEGATGESDFKGKGYGYSKKGGGWKARTIFDVTSQVRRAFEDRFDATYISVLPAVTVRNTWDSIPASGV